MITPPTEREIGLPPYVDKNWGDMTPEEQEYSNTMNTHWHIQHLYSCYAHAEKFVASYTCLYGVPPAQIPRRYARNPWLGGFTSYPVFDGDGEFVAFRGGLEEGYSYEMPVAGGKEKPTTATDHIIYEGDKDDPNLNPKGVEVKKCKECGKPV